MIQPALFSRATLPLETLADIERMRVIAGDAPNLPDGARVVTLAWSGELAAAWQWADQVDWRDAFAFKTIEGPSNLGPCSACGQFTVDLEDDFVTDFCADCWETGDWEVDA